MLDKTTGDLLCLLLVLAYGGIILYLNWVDEREHKTVMNGVRKLIDETREKAKREDVVYRTGTAQLTSRDENRRFIRGE